MSHQNKFREIRARSRFMRRNRFNNEEERILSRMMSKLIGLLLQLIIIFFAVSFLSYCFTYQNDQLIVESHLKNFCFDTGEEVKNLGGLWGAMLSYVFIYKYFGFISSWIVLFLFFILGSHLARFKFAARWNTWQIVCKSLFLIFIINSCVGVFHFGNLSNSNFSGFLSDVLANLMFKYFGVGTYFIIVFCILLFAFTSLKGRFKKKQQPEVEEQDHVIEQQVEDVTKDVLDPGKEIES